MILLAIRNSPHNKVPFSPAQAMYGHHVRSPFQLIKGREINKAEEDTAFVSSFTNYIKDLPMIPFQIQKRKEQSDKNLKTCTHVYLREDRIKPSLSMNYKGPYLGLERTEKEMTLLIAG